MTVAKKPKAVWTWDQIVRAMELINENHSLAIGYVEMLRIPVYDQEYLKRFNKTFSAHGLEMIRNALHQAGVMSLCRLWDSSKDALSIPNALCALRRYPHIKATLSRRHQGMMELPTEMAKVRDDARDPHIQNSLERLARRQAAEMVTRTKQTFRELYSLAAQDSFIELVGAVTNWRHKIAHPVVVTKLERSGVAVSPLKWGDLETALAQTSQIVALLNLLIDDLNIYPKDSHKVWERYGAVFWKSVSATPE
ncbi:AbiU2 domain-containing protein [Paramagnetospirillum kuznetsovii]|nr:hypothetical protein [Paramagnetospirillum kuznetsovii]